MTSRTGHSLFGSAVRTQCGRQIAVGRLSVDASGAADRVVLRIARLPMDGEQLWASLTPVQARLLAQELLAQVEFVQPASMSEES